MNAFLALAPAQRRELCEEAAIKLTLDARSIEKDYWVCWILRELFSLGEFGPRLTFKGGTSLSKAWKLIERFSEDVDVTIDREFLGFKGAQAPEAAPSNNQRNKRLENLKSACQTFIAERLEPAFYNHLSDKLPAGLTWTLKPDADDADRQTLLFEYPAVFAAGAYLRPVVKIEMGARSDTEPSSTPEIRPYLAEALPGELKDSAFKLRTLAAERTFWEKAMLLHEETYRASGAGPKTRLARHYYDLWRLIGAGVGDKALADTALFSRVAAHRAIFFPKRKEAQESLRPGSLRLLPPEDRRAAWKQDYEAMRETMFFGETPDFAEILSIVGTFESRFNKTNRGGGS